MDILLIQADGTFPNLALMKISTWHKQQGDVVVLKRGLDPQLPLTCFQPDRVYLSCIFTQNASAAMRLQQKVSCPIEVGGSGLNNHELSEEIEHLQPDYSLYGIDYSMGFTSRGCFRRCPYCIVWRKEGRIHAHAPIEEFLHPTHQKLLLLDNNFFASPTWRTELAKIQDCKIQVCFTQGLDIRLVDTEIATELAKTRYYCTHFKNRRLYFAFDDPNLESEVLQGISYLQKAGIPPSHLMFYILIGYNTSYEEDLHRIQVLAKERVLPYIMVYNDRHDSYYPHLERWINGRFYKIVPWREYKRGRSQEVIQASGVPIWFRVNEWVKA